MWIYNKKVDSLFIIFPHWIGIILVALLPHYFLGNRETSTLDWLILILFIDVAHVYATLFRTYLYPEALEQNKHFLIVVPVVCYCLGVVAMEISFDFFWRSLAYLAVFHFIRQQYGIIRRYQLNRQMPNWLLQWDRLFVYLFTILPVLIWHLEGPKNFVWFTANDFLFVSLPKVAFILKILLALLFVLLIFSFIVQWRYRQFMISKNLILLGTALNWTLGIVVLNGDLSFTLLNVVAHGIPYMALVWIQGTKIQSRSKVLKQVFAPWGWVIIIAGGALVGFVEEGLWDRWVWQENTTLFEVFSFVQPLPSSWLTTLVVPLLALPQITHYLIDGFIWKRSTATTVWKEPT